LTNTDKKIPTNGKDYENIELSLVKADDAPLEITQLVHDILYLDWDVPYQPVETWYNGSLGGRFAVARKTDGTLLGVCRLMPVQDETPDSIQIRQVVVARGLKGMGIGKKVMLYAEDVARSEGAKEIFLWSRQPAYGFYEGLGYDYSSDSWVSELTGLDYRTMTKRL